MYEKLANKMAFELWCETKPFEQEDNSIYCKSSPSGDLMKASI